MGTLAWSPHMALGVGPLDHARQIMVQDLAALIDDTGPGFTARLAGFAARLERNFGEEEALMEAVQLPEMARHREQHARLLDALDDAIADAGRGNCAGARSLLSLVLHWMVFHLTTMDTTLAVVLDMTGMTSGSKMRSPGAEGALS